VGHTLRVMHLRHSTTTGAIAVCLAAYAVSGCSVTTTSVSPTTSGASSASESPVPELDLQLRPVLDIANAASGQCTPTPPPTPSADAPAQVCSQDRILLYSLVPAAVTGRSVTGLDATMTQRTPQVQVKLDAQGGAALTRLTADGMVQPVPRDQMAIVSHGRVQSAPTITEAIDGNVLVITGFASVDDAQKAIDFLVS
jgi:preprotein translocase subunit SecD